MLIGTFPSLKALAMALAILVVVGVAGFAIFIWSGLYNVSAARDHFAITNWILEQVREQSVARRSAFVEPPQLDIPDMARLGAAHYEGVCVSCHARPGEKINPVAAQMLPPPPRLSLSLADNTLADVFWIVKNGLKYTGMPAWPTMVRDDEVWAVTSFLGKLRGAEEQLEYRALAGLDRIQLRGAVDPPTQGRGSVGLIQCIRCHDDRGLASHSTLIPKLAGQSPAYLQRALTEYASGRRPSGIMRPVASALDHAAIDRLVTYYASLPKSVGKVGEEQLRRGRELAATGDTNSGVPPCIACHGEPRSPQFPDLAGQNARYLRGQIEVFRSGARDKTTYGRLMTTVARRLTDQQADTLAAYFASLRSAPAKSPSMNNGAAAP